MRLPAIHLTGEFIDPSESLNHFTAPTGRQVKATLGPTHNLGQIRCSGGMVVAHGSDGESVILTRSCGALQF